MKKQIWLVFVATISTSVLAQTNAPGSSAPIATPAPAATAPATPAVAPAPAVTNAPAKRTFFLRKKRTPSAAKEPTFTEPPVVLMPGPAEVGVNNINVRGQASFKGEVITHLAKGDDGDGAGPDQFATNTRRASRRSGPKSPSRPTRTSGSTPNTLMPRTKRFCQRN